MIPLLNLYYFLYMLQPQTHIKKVKNMWGCTDIAKGSFRVTV